MYDAVETLSAKWEVLATKLRIQQHAVEAIKKNNPGDVDVCLNIMLRQWLKLNYDYQKYGRPSWRIIAKSVQRMDPGLFEEIAKDHPASKRNIHDCGSVRYMNFSCSSRSHDKLKTEHWILNTGRATTPLLMI